MKKCLQCEQVYGDETNFCLSDGTTLVSVAGSFTVPDETPTVFGNAPAPTVYSSTPLPTAQNNPQFIPPVASAPPPESSKSSTLLIALVVGFFALVVGGAVVGLVMYGLSKTDNTNVANVSNSADKSNRNSSDGQKSENNTNAQNLKQQQEKLERDKQKLEDERKALEAKKKEATTTPSSSRTAVIIDPPSNIRSTPNGTVLCIARTRGTVVNILGSTGVSDSNGVWYYTDYCGRQGVIHSSQIRF
jgi:hypothetical protein